MGLNTVHDYFERVAAAGIGWPLPEGLERRGTGRQVVWEPSGSDPTGEAGSATGPEHWNSIHEQLQQHRRS